MVSEIQRIAQALVAVIDELPGISGLLRTQIRRIEAQASELGDIANRTGDLRARHAALQLHAAAQACGRAVDRADEAHRKGRKWAAVTVGGGARSGSAAEGSARPAQGGGSGASPRKTLHLSTSERKDRRDLSRPEPDATIVVNGRFTYDTDGRGRVVKAKTTLTTVDRTTPRNKYAQRTLIDKIFGIDHAGHIFPRILQGPGNKINLVPMEAIRVNLGEYAALESIWRTAIEAGSKVDVTVELVYPKDTRRPSQLVVTYRTGGRPRRVVINNEVPDSGTEET